MSLEVNNRCIGINPIKLIEEALEAYKNRETEACVKETSENLRIENAEPIPLAKLSSRAKLGEILWNEMKDGKEISDSLIVELTYEKIKTLQPSTGFILDGFPTNYNQARLLEQKLTGYKCENNTSSNNSSARSKSENIQQLKGLDIIVLLDVSDEIILKRLAHTTLSKIELNSSSVVKYPMTHEETEMQSSSFVNNETNNDGNNDKNLDNNRSVTTHTDSFNYSLTLQETQGNILERLSEFVHSWPKLYKFYHGKLSNLCVVNLTDLLSNSTCAHDAIGDIDDDTKNESYKLAVYLEVERQIELFIERREQDTDKAKLSEQIRLDATPTNLDKFEEAESKLTLLSSAITAAMDNDKNSKKLSVSNDKVEDESLKVTRENTGSARLTERPTTAEISSSGKNSRNSEHSDSSKRERGTENKRKSDGSRSSSTGQNSHHTDNKERRMNSSDRNKQSESTNKVKSRSRSGSEKRQPKKTKLKSLASPQLVKPQNEESTPQPKLPQPGDENYQFVDVMIKQESAQILLKLWDSTKTVYHQNLKLIFRHIRLLNSDIIPRMYNIKQQFYNYLYRPDSKQHFVSQFIITFNSLLMEMRADKETKADLHCRTDDLRDTLYEIIDESKQANENRLEILLDVPGWFTHKQRLMINLYLSLFQVELAQFQEHAQLIKDYYNAMEAKPQTVEGEPIQVLSGTVDASRIEYTRIPLLKLPDDTTDTGDISDPRKSGSTRQNSSRSSSNRGNKAKPTDSGNNFLSRYPTPIDSKLETLPMEFRSQINLLNYNSSLQEVFAAFSKSGFALTNQSTLTQKTKKALNHLVQGPLTLTVDYRYIIGFTAYN
ncbi:unnamed protein product [Heterobilharzia americana]|nr:unnamed protein product [Heterobilharzia americana]